MDSTPKPFKHGGSSGYNYHKCRCDDCKAWKHRQRIKERDSGASAAQQRAYRAKNLERVRERERRVRESETAEQRAARLEYQRRYAVENAERKRLATRQWREADPHRAWVSLFAGRCAFQGVPVDDETRAWLEELRATNPPCWYCGQPWETVDHVVPVSKGGSSQRGNLVPCCHPCNRSKAALDPYVWAQRLAERINRTE